MLRLTLATLTVAFALAAFTLARQLAGKLDGVRRAVFDNTMVYWHYVVVQGVAGVALVHGFPRLING